MPLTDSPFNAVLAEARVARDMTIGDVSKATGFSRSFIAAYEQSAKNPTARTMLVFARAYGLEFHIDREGIAVWDAETGTPMLEAYDPIAEEMEAMTDD